MIIRIVRLVIHPEKLQDFRILFQNAAPRILEMEGCRRLRLLEDTRFSNVLSTYSEWDSEDALQNYRNSAFFATTWSQTRTLFAAAPTAHSYRSLDIEYK